MELVVVVVVILILASVSIPRVLTIMHSARLRGAASDFAGLLQVARIRAVQDDRYYSVYVLAASGNNPQEAFVDIYPQNTNGNSGTGGVSWTAKDPLVPITAEVNQKPAAQAPNTANLSHQLLPASSPVTPRDAHSTATPITFGPRGLPCAPTAVTGGTICNSAGGPTAYWGFFQNNVTQDWAAVTVTPAGRVQIWWYGGSGGSGAWNKQ